MQPFERRSVRYWSKETNETLPGGRKKLFFLIRDIDGPTMAAAPVESCQSMVLRSPRGRLGSVLYTCKRLRRMRRRFKHFRPNSLSSPRHFSSFSEGLLSRALREH